MDVMAVAMSDEATDEILKTVVHAIGNLGLDISLRDLVRAAEAAIATLRPEPPKGWHATAGFRKDRYFMTDGGDEWLLYTDETDRGAYS